LQSLRVKFSALVVVLLVVASVSLAVIATKHERGALEAEVEKRGRALATSLAGAAKEPLLAVEQGDFDGELTLERLIQEVGESTGVVAVRLLGREGAGVASLDAAERGVRGLSHHARGGDAGAPRVPGGDSRMLVAAPILYSGVRVGESQVELDLRVLVDPVVRGNTRQLTAAAAAVTCLGVVAGIVFVALLVGPLRRLRVGVEHLAAGDVTVRVPPTSRDEVGELTRAFNEMGDSLLQKQRIQKAFGRYVNDYVLAQLLDGPEGDPLTGIEREVTVLFADIRGFTRLSEGMEAQSIVALLNEIFQLVSDRILERGGTIDKFIGDSVMAYFGAPVPHSDHAFRAASAALDIVRTLEDRAHRSGGLDPGSPSIIPVEVGIGVHSGAVVVGNIGSDRRTDFTAVGDPVNVAHRLEKLAGPGEILVSEAVKRRVGDEIPLRFVGERRLSGREEPVNVYSLEIDEPPPKAGVARTP
jgi:class 3 adenylate cyclase